jgi:dTMP kinase
MGFTREYVEKNGLFLVFEGTDGAGTTTQAKLLKNFLVKRGYNVILTSEPSTEFIGTNIRQILNGRIIAKDSENIDSRTIALLFAADRLDHLQNVITPSLKKGYIVISDRYKLSSLVYQGEFTSDEDWVDNINKYAREPDMTFFIDINGEKAFDRISKNRPSLDIFEKKEFVVRIADKYKEVLNKHKHTKLFIVDGSLNVNDINKLITKSLNSLF